MIPFRATEPRPDEQIAGGFIPVAWAGEGRTLPVLSIRENREWSAKFAGSIRDRLASLEEIGTVDQVVELLMASMDTMVDLLLAYDRDSVLGDKEWIDTHVTDREVYETLKRVTAAAFPFGVDLRSLVPDLVPALVRSLNRGAMAAGMTLGSSLLTSGSQPSTAGRPTKSKRGSRTSS